MHLYYNILKN